MFEDSRSGFSSASENVGWEKSPRIFRRFQGLGWRGKIPMGLA